MSGIMLNEDCNHFVYTRHKAGIKVGINELHAFVDQYENTLVKELILNVNAMLAWFPAKKRENVIDKLEKYTEINKELGFNGSIVKTSYDIFIKQGIDMYKIWIDRARDKGISPWISIRMNDIHNNDDEENFLHSSFFQNNKHMRRASYRENSSYYDNALDYTFKEVQDHYLSFIEEVLDRYDIDGLELDWMREAFVFKIGGECTGISILNKFMRRVREIADRAEKIRNHKVKISVRMPQSPELALRFGFDVMFWAKSGLVDVVVPTARWATTDNDMPIDFWRRILDGTGVMLGAGLEILLEATKVYPKRVMYNSLESARGSAAAYLSMGADRIYLFNYMDIPDTELIDSRIKGSAIDPKYYRELLTTIGEIEIATSLPRRHIVTYHDITAPGVRVGQPLPIMCSAPDSKGMLSFNEVRIVTGPIKEILKATLVIGVNSEKILDGSDFQIYVNTKLCTFNGLVTLPSPNPECRAYAFEIDKDDKFPGVSIIEIASEKTFFTVDWVEIYIE
jgi:hypothetical protein